jgi:hypothetical protein
MARYPKTILVVMSYVVVWVTSSLIMHYLARKIIRFIGLNITQSKPENIGCCKIVWDVPLQIASYSLYAISFVLISIFIAKAWKSYYKNKFISKALIMLFIMIFPTHTFWGIASICGGFGGCAVGYHLNIIVPNVMSINPVAIGISAYIAYRIFKYMAHRYAQQINQPDI